MSNEAENQLKIHLGVKQDYSVSFATLFKVANSLAEISGNREKPTAYSLVRWLDSFGDFTSKKDPSSKLVNMIFAGLKPKEVMEVSNFIEYAQNGYKEN